MDYFGLNGPEDLPRIREVLADQVIGPTIPGGQLRTENGDEETITDVLVADADAHAGLQVSESGELQEAPDDTPAAEE
ncbi:MAG: hypothetical protein QM664_00035 [Flavihumibacter sp.]